jgi:hypothetical protein
MKVRLKRAARPDPNHQAGAGRDKLFKGNGRARRAHTMGTDDYRRALILAAVGAILAPITQLDRAVEIGSYLISPNGIAADENGRADAANG